MASITLSRKSTNNNGSNRNNGSGSNSSISSSSVNTSNSESSFPLPEPKISPSPAPMGEADPDNASNPRPHYAKNVRFDDRSSRNSETSSIASIKRFFRGRSPSDLLTPSPNISNTSSRRPNTLHGGMRNLRDIHSDDEDDDNVVSRVLNSITNGGLAPGFIDGDLPKLADAERDVPMVDYNAAAREILRSHKAAKDLQTDTDTDADDTHSGITGTTNDSQSFSSDASSQVKFTAPAMQHFDDNNGLDSDSDEDEDFDPMMGEDGYVPPPKTVQGGVLGSLLKMYQNDELKRSTSSTSLSGLSDTTDAFSSSDSHSDFKSDTDTHIIDHGTVGSSEDQLPLSEGRYKDRDLKKKKKMKKKKKKLQAMKLKKKLKRKKASLAKITVHIADLLQRHRFLLRMCKGLMMYGAPTHRLEEYMVMTSRVLEVDGQFLYIPGCMIVSFGDATTRTSEVQLVRCSQGLNLWKLHQVHAIYKKVIKDEMGADEGNILIDKILSEPNLYSPWTRVFLFGLCSAMVTPYAYGGHWINLAITFFMGSCVGALQYAFSQRSSVYSNIFEITASIVVSFCGRAFGSIPNSNICFGSVTQGSLALILPGYIILCGSLELQSRNLVAGSVRMFYAIIYSLFLGFGITLGATLFGWMYKGASNETSCGQPISPWYRFLFVPVFVIGNSMLNQARWSQLPVMLTIACIGYVVTYFAGKHFEDSTEFTASLAAFVIGVLGNLYARIWKGLAVSAMLPGIFCQVPSGVASHNSLLSGLQSANKIVKGNTTTIIQENDLTQSMSFGITMIQVSIGISVGLFASTLFVYPFGKTTGLFSL